MMKRDRLHFVDGYFAGAAEMASASCQNMKASNMTAFCFNPEPEFYIHSMAKAFGCEDADIELVETDRTIDAFLEDQFGEDKYALACAKRLKEMIYYHVGREKQALVFKEDRKFRELYSGYNDGNAPYYYVEELFVQVYDEGVVMFIVGNDE